LKKDPSAKPLSDVRGYESFIKSRDEALESVLRKYQRAMDRSVDFLKERVIEIIASQHLHGTDLQFMKRALSQLEQRLDREFETVERDVIVLLYRMRGTVFGLAHLGQAKALARTTGKDADYDLSHTVLSEELSKHMRSGGPVEHRAWMGFERLKRKVVDAYQRGILFEETPEEIIDRAMEAFPRARKYKRVPKTLKHPTLKEAEGDTALSITKKSGTVFGTIAPDLWAQMVEDYLEDEIPFYPQRQPQSEETYYEEHGKYEWEVEREASQEFVDQVRRGEITAANKNGINDFVWLAVVDDRTDECCLVRDGLTVTEIEAALESGEIDKDHCDAITPPAHFNCRCRIVPMTDEIEALEPSQEDGDFDEWLRKRL
jgi:hypothetical protein